MATSIPSIPQFYAGRHVLVTGGTGFLGKAVMERLLRNCPEIAKIYLIVRPKKGVLPAARVEELVKGELFDTLRAQQPDFTNKVVPIPGDLIEPGLGMSQEDAELIRENVSVIIHCAATVSFNEKLKLSLKLNVVSVQQMLAFARTFKKLAAFVHTSTAYAHCDRLHIEETFYPPVVNPRSLMDSVFTMSDELSENITRPLLGNRPNTYTLTKSLAEEIVRTDGEGLPCAVMRPSIVGCINESPAAGWQDNLNGPGGMYLASGTGLLRVMRGDFNAISDIVPVDFCASMLISIAWRLGTQYRVGEAPRVYNCTSGAKNPITWGEQIRFAKEAHFSHALPNPPLFAATFDFYMNERQLAFWQFLMHDIPATIGDTMLRLTGQKPILKRIYRKVDSSIGAYTPFTSKSWTWDVNNVEELWQDMSPQDRILFNFDMASINWRTYITDFFLGSRRFLPKESPEKIARDQLRNKLIRGALTVLLFLLLAMIVSVAVSALISPPSETSSFLPNLFHGRLTNSTSGSLVGQAYNSTTSRLAQLLQWK